MHKHMACMMNMSCTCWVYSDEGADDGAVCQAKSSFCSLGYYVKLVYSSDILSMHALSKENSPMILIMPGGADRFYHKKDNNGDMFL